MNQPALSAAAERNKGPILDVLEGALPATGRVLEIASGTGQHVAHFAARLTRLDWQPTEAEAERVAALGACLAAAPRSNVAAPLLLDVECTPWPVAAGFAAIVCINMIHIAPFSATTALLAGGHAVLAPRGVLILYGPFMEGGRHTAPSNEAFDRSLQARDPRWGVRDLGVVTTLAVARGFTRTRVERLPANNLCVAFERAPR